MSRVYWDTMVFAYMLEANPVFGARAQAAYARIQRRGDRLCTSTFTLGELLVRPRMKASQEAVSAITAFFRTGEIEMISFSMQTADYYSHVRSQSALKAADAIHLASAIEGKADLFLTNDQQILRTTVAGAPILVDLDGKIH